MDYLHLYNFCDLIITYDNYYVSYLPGLVVVGPPGAGEDSSGVVEVDVSSPKFYRLRRISQASRKQNWLKHS